MDADKRNAAKAGMGATPLLVFAIGLGTLIMAGARPPSEAVLPPEWAKYQLILWHAATGDQVFYSLTKPRKNRAGVWTIMPGPKPRDPRRFDFPDDALVEARAVSQ